MPYSPSIVKFWEDPSPLAITEWGHGVLLRSTNWLGDIMMTLPATWQLRKLLPAGVSLNVLAPAGLCGIWESAPWIDRVFPMAGHHISAAEAAEIRSCGFGVGVVLPNSFGSAMDLFKCGIPRRYGRKGNFRSLLLTDSIRRWPRGEGRGVYHQLSCYLELMASFGQVQLTADSPALSLHPELAEQMGVVNDGSFIALCPGAAYGPAKEWPQEHFRAVAQWHLSRGGRVVLVGTKKDAPLTAAIAAGLGDGVVDLAGRTDLKSLMAVLASCRAVVANDSGSMHLAAGVGTPGVALFASTDPVATGPIGASWELLVADIPCRPCLKRQCPFGHYDCMKQLTPQRVTELLNAM